METQLKLGDAGSCLSTFTPEAGYGYGDSDPLEVEAECLADGGEDCTAEGYVTEDAALCLADVYGLEPGIAPWKASLAYHYGYRTPIWLVMNTLEETPGTTSGNTRDLAASSGDLLDRGGWGMSTP